MIRKILGTIAFFTFMLVVACAQSGSQLDSSFFAGTAWWPNGANLALDFINDRYMLNDAVYKGIANFISGSGGSFSRSSTASYFDATGTMQTAAINSPRLDHDPNTGVAKGLLIEEASTNNVLQSSNFTTTWIPGSAAVTITPNAGIAPDGTNTATLLSGNGTGSSFILQNIGAVAGQTITRSFFVKPGTTDFLDMEFGDTTNCVTFCNTHFQLNAQTSVWSAVHPGEGPLVIQPMENGWYRISTTFTYSAVGAPTVVLYFAAYGAGVGNISIWGAQQEFKAFPTSYIPTVGATVTRSADTFSFPAASWFNANAGTFLSTGFGQLNSNTVDFGRVVGGDNLHSYTGFDATLNAMSSSDNSTTLPVTGTITASPTTSVNMAMAWDQTSSTESVAMSSSQLATGSFSGNWATTNIYPGGSNSSPLNTSVSTIIYFPTRQANSTLTTWAK